MKAKLLAPLLAVSAGLMATAAIASTSRDDDKPVPPLPAVAAAPANYTVKVKGPIAAPAGKVTRGLVKCPRSAPLDLGGGALVASQSPEVSLATSNPAGTQQAVDDRIYSVSVVNASPDATTFRVYATCVMPQRSWVNGDMGSFDVAPHSLGSFTTHVCQAITPAVPTISAGPQIAGSSLLTTLHDSRPTLDHNWQVRVNNNGGTTRTVNTRGVCLGGLGAHVVLGAQVSNPPFAQTN